MNLNIYCNNCHEHILQADTETLTSPLVGSMFTAKTGMEWAIFSQHDKDLDLICPLCNWLFHMDGRLEAEYGAVRIMDYPEDIVKIFGTSDGFVEAEEPEEKVTDVTDVTVEIEEEIVPVIKKKVVKSLQERQKNIKIKKKKKKCSKSNCSKDHYAKGLCKSHWLKQNRLSKKDKPIDI